MLVPHKHNVMGPYKKAACSLFLFSLNHRAADSRTTITSIPSSTTNILYEESTIELTNVNGGLLGITSDIPITIHRYNDRMFVSGQQPVFPSDATLLITSDCDSSQTTALPSTAWSFELGELTVSMGVTSEHANSMSFLDTSSYQMAWTWQSWTCNDFPTPAPFSLGSVGPTIEPLFSVTGPASPTQNPTTRKPSTSPTDSPTTPPTPNPSKEPTTSPTPEPTTSPTSEPTAEVPTVESLAGGPRSSPTGPEFRPAPSSAFAVHRSFSFRLATALAALLLIAILMPDQAGSNTNSNYLLSFGKLAVAAFAVTSLFSRSSKSTPGSDNQRSLLKQSRSLDTCTYNVELLLDGCYHPLDITAPAARVVDVVIDNVDESLTRESCVFDYNANLSFPVTDESLYLDLSLGVANLDALPFGDCIRPVDGRPFVDTSGKALQALPLVASNDALDMSSFGIMSRPGDISSNDIARTSSGSCDDSNVTSYHPSISGEEWTRRALGEHASVASFSAFSIALMTNHAPSKLVEDALKAGLDEIRHARVSFEIASKLVGREVGPGPLPESSHEFGMDLTALALSVAREGCVDETLSAFAAALEVDGMEKEDNPKYFGVDNATLRWMKREVQTIAMEESNHSALAWRSLYWVCSIDADACDTVKRDVLKEAKLESSFDQRFGFSRGSSDAMMTMTAMTAMRKGWQKVYSNLGHLRPDVDNIEMRESLCGDRENIDLNDEFEEVNDSESLVDDLTENILRGVLCDESVMGSISI